MFPGRVACVRHTESQYKQLGNAVPVSFGQAVGLTILDHMRSGSSGDPVPGFKYSRYGGTSDKDWCGARCREGQA